MNVYYVVSVIRYLQKSFCSQQFVFSEDLCCTVVSILILLNFINQTQYQETEHQIMSNQECTAANLALIFQILILAISFIFSMLTIAMILIKKHYMNSFTFLILMIQSCYASMAIIDLFTKVATISDAYIIWCKVVSPIIYAAISSSFLLMELFVIMIYKTINRQISGWIKKKVKMIAVLIILFCICINCVGIPFYGLGFCESCGLHTVSRSSYEIFVYILIQIDYYVPMALMIPTFYFIYKLIQIKNTNYMDNKQALAFKVLTIPILNFVILSISGILNSLPNKVSDEIPVVAYLFLFDSIYFTSIINFIFYKCFVNFFDIDEKLQSENLCCQCNCLKNNDDDQQAEMVFNYVNRRESFE